MHKSLLELSPQVKKGRYANLSIQSDQGDRTFMLGYEECKPDYIIERNSFPFWTLEVVVGGHGFYQDRKQQRKLGHGAVYTYGPNVAQHFGNDKERPFRKYFMVRSGTDYPELWRDAGLRPGRLFQLGNLTSIVSVFDQLLDEGQRSDAQTSVIVSGLEEVLIALITRHRGTAKGDRSGARKAYDLAMDILQREFRSLLTLSDLADRSGYSSEYLCRIFKKYHGESPYQVLLHRKMSAAWLLLRDGQFQVGVVAAQLGFADPLHFSRVFRKIMGCSPSSVQTRV